MVPRSTPASPHPDQQRRAGQRQRQAGREAEEQHDQHARLEIDRERLAPAGLCGRCVDPADARVSRHSAASQHSQCQRDGRAIRMTSPIADRSPLICDVRRWRSTVDLVEFELLDARAALLDLLGRDHDGAGCPRWPGRNASAACGRDRRAGSTSFIRWPTSVADQVGGLAHPRVLLDLLDHLDRQHQQRRRHHHDLGAIGLLHDVVEAVVQFGIDRFRRHEHQRHVLRLAGDQVFLGDVVDVLHRRPARTRCAANLRSSSVLAVAERGDAFEREFGVDHQRPLVGQQHARSPAACRSTACTGIRRRPSAARPG